jgi:myo-inositol 2-dehydrogenase/D-chiro-inositol 1-dehydrogenase
MQENKTKIQTNGPASSSNSSPDTSRRQFLQNGSKLAIAGAAAGALVTPKLSLARSAHAFGTDTVKIGLIGCGGRGTQAAMQAMNTTSGNVELVAMADAFQNRLDQSLKGISNKDQYKDKVQVPKDRQFTGFDAFKGVIESDANLVILATPPGFRPMHFEAAVNAGKHVFMEKPVAVDAPGIRRVLKAGELAKQKNLLVQVGLQRRHQTNYKQTIAELQNGAIGELVCSRVYWNGGGVWTRGRAEGETELGYQMKNWYYFNWLCGDHITEQHIHNLDVGNWLMDDFPVDAQGQGGRQVRTGPDSGQIFDHHSVEYTFANGHKMFSMCRHMPGCWNNVSEHVHGSKGWCNIGSGTIYDADGKQIFKANGSREENQGHQQEHHDLFADLRDGKMVNEAEYGAKSTMTSIIGRLATYSGKLLKWDDAINSDISLCDVDALHSMDDEAPLGPDKNGKYPVAVPGTGAKDIIDWKA